MSYSTDDIAATLAHQLTDLRDLSNRIERSVHMTNEYRFGPNRTSRERSALWQGSLDRAYSHVENAQGALLSAAALAAFQAQEEEGEPA